MSLQKLKMKLEQNSEEIYPQKINLLKAIRLWVRTIAKRVDIVEILSQIKTQPIISRFWF